MSAPSSTTIDLTAKVEQYLAERLRLGFKPCSSDLAVRHFTRFMAGQGHDGALTVDVMVQWARQVQPRYLMGGQIDGATAARRLATLRPFMRWLQQFDPSVEVPDDSSFGPIPRRVAPHIYSEAEIAALIVAARRLGPSDGLRAATYATLFGLIASAGLRVSEAINLADSDADLDGGVLTIQQTKFGKSRMVPVHPSVIGPLAAYRALRRQHVHPKPQTTFFVGSRGVRRGEPLGDRQVHRMFCQLREQLGWIDRGGHGRPRVHDLRHNSGNRIIPSSALDDVRPSEVTVWSDVNRRSELSEALQELHDTVARLKARHRNLLGGRVGECALLHLHVRVQVDGRGLRRFVAKPERDQGLAGAVVQQVHGQGVATMSCKK